MLHKKLLGEELLALQKERGNICISIIVPTHKLSPDRRVDEPELKSAINSAKQLMEYKYRESQIKILAESLDELYNSLDFSHQEEGLGLYVSPNIKVAVQFPFPVQGKVMVEDNFELRDLLYKVNNAVPYFVLLVSENGASLFEGSWAQLEEIRDGKFPEEYEEEFIYNPPSRGTSYGGQSHVKSFEKDKSEVEEIRHKDFYKRMDEHLKFYLVQDTPLIVMGPKKILAWYENVTVFQKQIIGKISGNYSHQNAKQLADLSWPLMKAHMQNERTELLREFEEKIGERMGISGIQEVWRAVKEGKGFKLLVEKDFRSPGFVDEDAYHLYLRPPKNEHKVLADAVDEIIEMVIEKNGHVYITENGVLKEHNRIALITRY